MAVQSRRSCPTPARSRTLSHSTRSSPSSATTCASTVSVRRFRAPQQGLFALEQGQGALLAPQVGHRRRQPGGHQRRGIAQAPAFGAVGVRQALADGGFLELVERIDVRRVLAEVRPARHVVGGRHVHEDLDCGAGQQAAKEALEDDGHLRHRLVGDGADVARLHAPRAAQGGVPRVARFLEQDDAVFRVANHRTVRQQQGERAMVGAGDVDAFSGGGITSPSIPALPAWESSVSTPAVPDSP